jgi:hypothetical protein
MRPLFSTLVRLVPLAAASFLMAADGEACIVLQNNTNTGEGEGEACPDLTQLCPSLVCDAGNVVDADGCAICECVSTGCAEADAAAAPLPPECVNPFFDAATCSWVCSGGACRADAECPQGAVCLDGTCQRATVGCSTDAECGLGSYCSFESASDPLPPDDSAGGGGSGAPAPGPTGTCTPLPNCFSDADCAFGQHCVPLNAAGGLVAVQSVCVDATPCTADTDCTAPEVCIIGDQAARPCRDTDGDGICDGATEPPPPPQGFCGQPTVIPGCFSDVDCGAGAVCRMPEGCACNICVDDGNGGCLPCDCAGIAGTCEPVGPGDGECFDDTACADGETCVIYAVGCEQPACETGPDGTMVCHPCDPLAIGRCEPANVTCISDLDCGPDAFCALPDVAPPCDPNQGCDIPVPLPEGVCVPLGVDACSTVRCDIGTVCVVDDAGNASCQTDPCLFTRCTAETHCEVQQNGNAFCASNTAECTSDADCGDLVCNAAEVCMSNPSCTPDSACTDECWGICIPPR